MLAVFAAYNPSEAALTVLSTVRLQARVSISCVSFCQGKHPLCNDIETK